MGVHFKTCLYNCIHYPCAWWGNTRLHGRLLPAGLCSACAWRRVLNQQLQGFYFPADAVCGSDVLPIYREDLKTKCIPSWLKFSERCLGWWDYVAVTAFIYQLSPESVSRAGSGMFQLLASQLLHLGSVRNGETLPTYHVWRVLGLSYTAGTSVGCRLVTVVVLS